MILNETTFDIPLSCLVANPFLIRVFRFNFYWKNYQERIDQCVYYSRLLFHLDNHSRKLHQGYNLLLHICSFCYFWGDVLEKWLRKIWALVLNIIKEKRMVLKGGPSLKAHYSHVLLNLLAHDLSKWSHIQFLDRSL